MFTAVGRLTGESGVAIGFVGYGANQVRRGAGDNWIAIQEYQFRTYCGTAKFYHPPRYLSADEKTGQIDLSWANPPDRWDRYRVRLMRKTGSTAPTSLTDGTEVTLGANLPTSFSDTGLSADTYSYSLFASYSEFDATTQQDDATSAAATVEGVEAF